MLSRSAKQKGKRFETIVADAINVSGLDNDAKRNKDSGSGISEKGDVISRINWVIECKNEKGVSKWLLNHIDQSKREGEMSGRPWVLVIRDPRTPESGPQIYATIDFYEFLELVKRSEPLIDSNDREFKYKVSNLKKWCSDVLKMLE